MRRLSALILASWHEFKMLMDRSVFVGCVSKHRCRALRGGGSRRTLRETLSVSLKKFAKLGGFQCCQQFLDLSFVVKFRNQRGMLRMNDHAIV
jgi:hypothetical protein